MKCQQKKKKTFIPIFKYSKNMQGLFSCRQKQKEKKEKKKKILMTAKGK